MNPIHQCFQKISPETVFHSEIKGHNSDKNRWILSVIELDLYFMIIYLCMKYESNTPMYSKDIARKPFFVRTGRTYVRTYVRTDVRTRVMLYAPPPAITNGGGIKTTENSTPEPEGQSSLDLVFMQYWECEEYQVYSSDDPRMTLTFLTSRSSLLLNAM